jgi:hypothetical protein
VSFHLMHWQKCDEFGAWVCSAPASFLYQTKDVASLCTLGFSMAIFLYGLVDNQFSNKKCQ